MFNQRRLSWIKEKGTLETMMVQIGTNTEQYYVYGVEIDNESDSRS